MRNSSSMRMIRACGTLKLLAAGFTRTPNGARSVMHVTVQGRHCHIECCCGCTVRSGVLRRNRMSFEPGRAGGRKRIYSALRPPGALIATAMDFAVVRAT